MCNLTHDQIVLVLLHRFTWDNNSIQHTSFEFNLLVSTDQEIELETSILNTVVVPFEVNL